ncbi:alpha/beta hydrolase [Bergeriella denitrificans]|uniref:Predicted hydrolase of the alpha/beta superfamily n=1 Tax=Bergeriella denitrificans TaxID=494 RepID=A0A378UF55_BERDE|nr:alpha/beta hydrolase-fold protein [Bergeriella denitrificans]STZ75957.1 Predicted hydrolase of the alpha/beta superfamily [Bergeriella denitrificans]
MHKHSHTIAGKTVSAYLPARADLPLLLTFLTQEESDQLAALLNGQAALISVDEPLWEHAFTPWPAPAAFKKAPEFSGGADDNLNWIIRELLPQIEQTHALQPQWRGLIGYSLGGLFTAYAAYQPTPFTRFASVSGSLWFDGWADFIANHSLNTLPHTAYFSVGDTEKNSKNPRMAVVETNTLATRQNWQTQGVSCTFELNSGGHFQDIPQRMAKAASYLLENTAESA